MEFEMQNEIKNRKIEHLWHFTRIENLDNILKNGLAPRSFLESQKANVKYNDQYRLDGCKNATCLSVGHPNYKMFYSLRRQDELQEWVVLGIKPEILWLKDCAFCHENAASSSVTSIALRNRKGLDAFKKIFHPVAGKPDREVLRLPDDCPTNPQAEILVFDIIEPNYIIGAVTNSKNTENILKQKYSNFEFLYHRAHFSARLDYEHW